MMKTETPKKTGTRADDEAEKTDEETREKTAKETEIHEKVP